MPRIPTYDTPQAEARALPGVRQSSVASPALFGAGAEQQAQLGRSMINAGAAGLQIAGAMQERDNLEKVQSADATYKERLLGWKMQATEKYRGTNADAMLGDFQKWHEEQTKELGQALGNEQQRNAFGVLSRKNYGLARNDFGHFVLSEKQKTSAAVLDASVANEVNLAAVAGSDEEVTARKRNLVANIQAYAAAHGWADEVTTQKTGDALTNLHLQRLQSMTGKNYEGAKAYYEANKGEINGSVRDKAEALLEEGGLRHVTQKATDEVMSKRLGLGGALDYVRKNYSGKEEDEIVRRVKERYADAEAAMRQGQRYAADNAWKILTQGGDRSAIPVSTWNSLSGHEQMQISNYLGRRAEVGVGGTAKHDDVGSLTDVERMIEQGDITSREQLTRYAPFLSAGTIKTLGNKLDKRGVVPPTDIRRVFEERKGAKVNVAKMGEGDRNEWMAFQNYILENVKETKRPEDIDVWADRWFLKGYGKDDSFFRNDPDTYGEARTKGRTDFVISTPDAARATTDQALGLLSRAGVPMPKDKTLARDEFYTKNVLEAERWAAAHGQQNSPSLTAAYALLKQNKKPVTPANLQYLMEQFK